MIKCCQISIYSKQKLIFLIKAVIWKIHLCLFSEIFKDFETRGSAWTSSRAAEKSTNCYGNLDCTIIKSLSVLNKRKSLKYLFMFVFLSQIQIKELQKENFTNFSLKKFYHKNHTFPCIIKNVIQLHEMDHIYILWSQFTSKHESHIALQYMNENVYF